MKITETKSVEIPVVEVLAAFRMSAKTAKREGFSRIAEQVEGYISAIEEICYNGDWTFRCEGKLVISAKQREDD